ncbi:hypothetical protein [Paenibacillus sp. NPDC058174]|uniref:hypothetical protein n=1 Tax=Paenibacillus sp. NPDC058174 TaxID=3346366 RepID=UPI0036D7AF91
MAFTFPKDSNNKAGAVRTKNAGTEFVMPVQDEMFDVMEIKRSTLAVSTNTQLSFTGAQSVIEVHNLGPGELYACLDAAATVNGANSILVPEGAVYVFPIKGTVVNVISSGTPKVQAVGVKNNA